MVTHYLRHVVLDRELSEQRAVLNARVGENGDEEAFPLLQAAIGRLERQSTEVNICA
jgi:hypothetical protein